MHLVEMAIPLKDNSKKQFRKGFATMVQECCNLHLLKQLQKDVAMGMKFVIYFINYR